MIEVGGSAAPKLLNVPVTDAFGWSADSKSILYVVRGHNSDNLWQIPITDAPPVQITHFTSDRITRFDQNPDGKRLLITRSSGFQDVVMISGW